MSDAPEEKKPTNDEAEDDDEALGPEFFLDQPSPTASPRDAKKPRLEESEASTSSPRRSQPPLNLLTAASPPRFISFEEIMRAANGVSNMALAHEIAVDNEFRFQKNEPGEKSLEKQVRDMMHKAFWDVLDEKLKEDPPDYSHALILLKEVKENLEELLLPHHSRIRTEIREVIDLPLVEQQAEAGTLDFFQYSNFIIDTMAKLCAPARDEEVAKLREMKEVIPLYREIFRVLEILKMDMANFTIQQIRPYLQQQSVNYERTKFQQLLKSQEENGTDGLQFTRLWLSRNAQKEFSAAKDAQTLGRITPIRLLNAAYLEVLDWDDSNIYPETLLMDEHRFRDLKEKTQWLILVSSVLLITYNTVGASIAGISSLKSQLKQHTADIIAGIPSHKFGEVMENVSAQVDKDVNACLVEHGFSAQTAERSKLLKGQVEEVASPSHSVHKIIRSRLFKFILDFISSPNHSQPVQIPPGFSAVSEELSHVCGQFTRLLAHNRAVFGVYYADIVGALLREHQSSDDKDEDAPGPSK